MSEHLHCLNGGGKYYACTSGSRFVGCCKRNPCQNGCAREDRLPLYFDAEAYGTFPDQECSEGLFYGCYYIETPYSTNFIGCCQSMACRNNGCPYEDLGVMILSNNPSAAEAWSAEGYQKSINLTKFVSQSNNTVSLIEPTEQADGASIELHNSFPLALTTALAVIALCTLASFGLLLSSAFASHQRSTQKTQNEPSERMPLNQHSTPPSMTATPDPSKQAQASIYPKSGQLSDNISARKNMPAYVLIHLSCITAAAVVAFLGVLWFANTTRIWTLVMSRGWATRAVSISTLVLRTAIDVQAGIAATMLAALFIESSAGIPLPESVAVAILRFCATPWTLAQPIVRCSHRFKKSWIYLVYSGLLFTVALTTALLQVSSTALLTDLGLGALPGVRLTRQLAIDFSYECMSDTCADVYLNQIPHSTTWGLSPAFFPAFAEYSEPPAQQNPLVADTGILLRAFPPYADATSRQSLRNHTGKTFILDSRVSCQAPQLDHLVWDGSMFSNFSGQVSTRLQADYMQEILQTPFACVHGGIGQSSLCQINSNPFQHYTGSLNSQFANDSQNPDTYGTSFLVVKVDDISNWYSANDSVVLGEDSGIHGMYHNEWLDIQNTTLVNSSAMLSLSYCFSPWDAARLNATLYSESNRTEPSTRWHAPPRVDGTGSFDMSQVLHQLGLGSKAQDKSHSERGILTLDRPSSTVPALEDRRPQKQRPFIQTDPSNIGSGFGGANIPLSANWTVFLAGDSLGNILMNYGYTPSSVFAADPSIANLFESALALPPNTSSVAHALASAITVLSSMAYYNQMPAFDYTTEVEEDFFEPVLIPLGTRGFIAFVCVLAAHMTIVCVIVSLFRFRTKLSLLGEAWASVAPLITQAREEIETPLLSTTQEDACLRDIMENSGQMTDSEVAKKLNNEGLKVRSLRLEADDSILDGSGSPKRLKFRIL